MIASEQLIQSAALTESGKAAKWTGRILWALAVPFMFFDCGLHLASPQFVIDVTTKLGFNASVIRPIGVAELICLILYVIPRTQVLGGVLLTAYLGGAVAVHVFSGTPFAFAIIFAVMLWGSLYCRDARVRAAIS